jgi:hypothetical protein
MVCSVKGLSSCIAEKENVNDNTDKSPCLEIEFLNPKVIPEMGNTYNILILNGLQMTEEIQNCSY